MIAIGLLVMMYPILCKVRYEILHEIFSQRGIWRQMAFSVFMNWIVAPFLMVCLGTGASRAKFMIQKHIYVTNSRCSLRWPGCVCQTSRNCGRAWFLSGSVGVLQWYALPGVGFRCGR